MNWLQAASRTGANMFAEHNGGRGVGKRCEFVAKRGSIVVTGSIFLVGEAMAEMGTQA